MTYDVLVLLTLFLYHPTFNVTNEIRCVRKAQHVSDNMRGKNGKLDPLDELEN
jgi:hypothetical protein